MTETIEEKTIAGLRALGVLPDGQAVELVPLTGGVASDIWSVQSGDDTFVVKRALAKLRVAADWRAPVSRNASEVAWMRLARGAAPDAVPEILAHSPEMGFFVMELLPPELYPVWKQELREGRVDPAFAHQVGASLGDIHAASAGQADIAAKVNDDALFRAIRIEPYLEFTAGKHPVLSDRLMALSRDTLSHHLTLVHGDVSPKNILVGPNGPVFLDAECAWYGDPAFDLAFCLNHLLLKCLLAPQAVERLVESFTALKDAYLTKVNWEDRSAIEARAAVLLPALLLARIDGKSPVEYVTDPAMQESVRQFAIPFITSPQESLSVIADQWKTLQAEGPAS